MVRMIHSFNVFKDSQENWTSTNPSIPRARIPTGYDETIRKMAVIPSYDGLADHEIVHAKTCHNHTTYTVVTTRVNGTVSVIASALLILVILKSETKLKTIDHRILFGMSCADVLSSIATALNTLPMPKRGFYGTNALHTCYDYWPVTRHKIRQRTHMRSTGLLFLLRIYDNDELQWVFVRLLCLCNYIPNA